MIRIIAGEGYYFDGRKRRSVTPSDGPVRLPRYLEEKWVSQGIAAYVDEAPAPAETADGAIGDDQEQETPEPEGDEADYGSLTLAELKAECDERGIPYRKRDRKAELVRLLEADDEPPTFDALGAE